MNSPVKHHFSPAFSLQPWARSDGLLCEIRRINGRVVASRKHPNATGSLRLVYRGDIANNVVAQKLIELAKAGERDPERLCESVLQQWGHAVAHAPPIVPGGQF